MDTSIWFYVGFTMFVLTMLALDLGVFHREAHVVKPKEAGMWVGIWMSLAGVFGKNDGDIQGLLAKASAGFGAELYEGPHSFELSEQRILVVHDIGDVQPRSIEGHSIVVHGFTHQQEMKHRGDTLIVNPGEACGWIYGTPKAAILDLATKQVEFLSLDPSHWTT